MEHEAETHLNKHEKFYAFCLLGASVLILALMAYFYPPEDGSGAQRIIDAAMGGLLLALGAAANALFRISNATEQQAIGRETAKALTEQSQPIPTLVTNPITQPVPTTEPAHDGELKEEEKL